MDKETLQNRLIYNMIKLFAYLWEMVKAPYTLQNIPGIHFVFVSTCTLLMHVNYVEFGISKKKQ